MTSWLSCSPAGCCLASARGRLAGWRDDPRRHAEHALKVLVAFKLLEARRLSPAELSRMVVATFDGNVTLRALFPIEPEAMAAFIAQELVRVGAASRVDGVLVTREQGPAA